MSWKDEPATEIQVNRLRQLGYQPEHPLTKGEAAHLITNCEGGVRKTSLWMEERTPAAVRDEAYQFRLAVEHARRTVSSAQGWNKANAERELQSAVARRQRFWMDTCCEPTQMRRRSEEVIALHMKHGCQFITPTAEQAQEILDALDTALASWDREHPNLFFQTLELNFPETKRMM